VIEAIQNAGGSISYSQLEKRMDILKGRNLLCVVCALIKRGIIEAESEEITTTNSKLKGLRDLGTIIFRVFLCRLVCLGIRVR